MCICSPLTEHVWWSSTIFKVKLILKFYLTIRVHSINRELFPSHGSSNMLLFRHMRRPLVHATWHATCHLDSCNMGWEVLCVPSGWVGCLTLLNELCPELVSLVFFAHTFFGLAEFCKKPCNPVFNVLQFFKKILKNILLFFSANVLGPKRVASQESNPRPLPCRNSPLQEM